MVELVASREAEKKEATASGQHFWQARRWGSATAPGRPSRSWHEEEWPYGSSVDLTVEDEDDWEQENSSCRSYRNGILGKIRRSQGTGWRVHGRPRCPGIFGRVRVGMGATVNTSTSRLGSRTTASRKGEVAQMTNGRSRSKRRERKEGEEGRRSIDEQRS